MATLSRINNPYPCKLCAAHKALIEEYSPFIISVNTPIIRRKALIIIEDEILCIEGIQRRCPNCKTSRPGRLAYMDGIYYAINAGKWQLIHSNKLKINPSVIKEGLNKAYSECVEIPEIGNGLRINESLKIIYFNMPLIFPDEDNENAYMLTGVGRIGCFVDIDNKIIVLDEFGRQVPFNTIPQTTSTAAIKTYTTDNITIIIDESGIMTKITCEITNGQHTKAAPHKAAAHLEGVEGDDCEYGIN